MTRHCLGNPRYILKIFDVKVPAGFSWPSPPPQHPRSRLYSRQQPLPVTLPLFPPSTHTDSVLCHRSPSENRRREGETLPVSGETVSVRVKSGHFTGFSGIAPGRKSACRILPGPHAGIVQYFDLIFRRERSGANQETVPFFKKPCRIGLPRGESGHLTGPDYRIPQPPVKGGESDVNHPTSPVPPGFIGSRSVPSAAISRIPSSSTRKKRSTPYRE